MNERIRELELQAADGTVDPNGPFTAEEFNNFTKKFAELIVQKCADIGALKADGNYEVYNSIVEYFGMEEE
jgi:hypothetical protein